MCFIYSLVFFLFAHIKLAKQKKGWLLQLFYIWTCFYLNRTLFLLITIKNIIQWAVVFFFAAHKNIWKNICKASKMLLFFFCVAFSILFLKFNFLDENRNHIFTHFTLCRSLAFWVQRRSELKQKKNKCNRKSCFL